MLDTFRDRQNGFVFGTNPGAIEYDGQVRSEGVIDTNWDGSWSVATSQDENGWYVEMRIPFSTLRYASGGEQAWGLNMTRYIGRRNEQVVWSPIPRQFTFYRLTEAGVLSGVEPPLRRVMTVTPYALGAVQRIPSIAPDAQGSFEVGADAKFGITQSLSLDLTVNTDFAQVDVDDQQVDLTRFSLFFPEKRTFFLENAGLFTVGLTSLPGRTSGSTQIFHSRRIGVAGGQQVPITWGGRLSGRAAGLDVGLLHMRTGGQDGLQPATDWTVARLARELPNRSRVGAIVTSRLASGRSNDYNRAYAVDARIGVGEEWTFTGVAGLTDSPGVTDSESLYSLLGEYRTLNWYVRSYYDRIGENFDPETGFIPYSGYQEGAFRLERFFRPRSEWLREIRVHTRQILTYDLAGFKEGQVAHLHTNFVWENGTNLNPALNWVVEGLKVPFRIPGTDIVVPAGTYSGWTSAVNGVTTPTAPVSFTGRVDAGTFLSGNRVAMSGGVLVRRGASLSGEFNITHNRLRLPQGDFDTTLTRFGLRYAFSPEIFVQSQIQYSDQTGVWLGNLRFGWLNTAGTGLFLVYNDRQLMDVSGVSGLWPRDALRPAERTFVVKYTRQFDLGSIMRGGQRQARR